MQQITTRIQKCPHRILTPNILILKQAPHHPHQPAADSPTYLRRVVMTRMMMKKTTLCRASQATAQISDVLKKQSTRASRRHCLPQVALKRWPASTWLLEATLSRRCAQAAAHLLNTSGSLTRKEPAVQSGSQLTRQAHRRLPTGHLPVYLHRARARSTQSSRAPQRKAHTTRSHLLHTTWPLYALNQTSKATPQHSINKVRKSTTTITTPSQHHQ